MGALTTVVWHLENRCRTSRTLIALKNGKPAALFKIRSEQYGEVPNRNPERDGDIVGRKAGNPGLGSAHLRQQAPNLPQEVHEGDIGG